jgi:hypothetical protein
MYSKGLINRIGCQHKLKHSHDQNMGGLDQKYLQNINSDRKMICEGLEKNHVLMTKARKISLKLFHMLFPY